MKVIKKKKKRVIICIIIIILILIISITLNNYFKSRERYFSKYSYTVEIDPEENGNFSLYVPIAYNNAIDNSISDVMNHLKIIRGEGNYALINTLYGIALKINGSGYIFLKSKETRGDEYFGLYLSMIKQEIGKRTLSHWIYCESEIENISIKIQLINEAGRSGSGKSEKTYPEIQIIYNIGWQEIITETDNWGI